MKPPGVEGRAGPVGGVWGHSPREAVGGGGCAALHARGLIDVLIK